MTLRRSLGIGILAGIVALWGSPAWGEAIKWELREEIADIQDEFAQLHAMFRAEQHKPPLAQSTALFRKLIRWNEGLVRRMDAVLRNPFHPDFDDVKVYEDARNLRWTLLRHRDSVESSLRIAQRAPEEAREKREQAERDRVAREKREEAKREQAEHEQAERDRVARELRIMAKGWPPEIQEAVIQRGVLIGMTAEQVIMAWGKPERVNETISARGRSEQWVYPTGQYLYFENGRLTTIQTRR